MVGRIVEVYGEYGADWFVVIATEKDKGVQTDVLVQNRYPLHAVELPYGKDILGRDITKTFRRPDGWSTDGALNWTTPFEFDADGISPLLCRGW